ncbi:MAG: LD-carboxypeptidase [Deltaproteobacteria bacterium]|nr:LD-carboxypeptidase [Deltaproteobacteria bacterium]
MSSGIKKIIPNSIKQNDVVGIVAPASPFNTEELYKGVEIIKSLGFKVNIPQDIFFKKKYLAGEDANRARIINKMFADKNIKGIMSAKGGFGSMRLLPYIDYQTAKKNPKLFIGFSDISALLSAYYTFADIMTVHGPVVTSLAAQDAETIKSFYDTVTLKSDINLKIENGVVIKQGKSEGSIVGGNLATLCHLAGTAYQPDFKDCILFLEDTSEKPYKIDRMLTHIKFAGYFKQISGILLGSFDNCGQIQDIYQIVADKFKKESFPILAGFKAGHDKTNLSFLIGRKAYLNADEKRLSFENVL